MRRNFLRSVHRHQVATGHCSRQQQYEKGIKSTILHLLLARITCKRAVYSRNPGMHCRCVLRSFLLQHDFDAAYHVHVSSQLATAACTYGT